MGAPDIQRRRDIRPSVPSANYCEGRQQSSQSEAGFVQQPDLVFPHLEVDGHGHVKCTLEVERWRNVDPHDWVEGGKYFRVRHAKKKRKNISEAGTQFKVAKNDEAGPSTWTTPLRASSWPPSPPPGRAACLSDAPELVYVDLEESKLRVVPCGTDGLMLMYIPLNE